MGSGRKKTFGTEADSDLAQFLEQKIERPLRESSLTKNLKRTMSPDAIREKEALDRARMPMEKAIDIPMDSSGIYKKGSVNELMPRDGVGAQPMYDRTEKEYSDMSARRKDVMDRIVKSEGDESWKEEAKREERKRLMQRLGLKD